MKSSKDRIVALLLALLCAVISLDTIGKIPFGRYDLRWSYFVFAALGVVFLVNLILGWKRDGEEKRHLLASVRSGWFLSFVGMSIVGLLGAATNSLNPSRSWMFLIWSAGTLLTVPLILSWAGRLQERQTTLFLLALFAVLVIVCAHDLANCTFGWGWPYWGGVLQRTLVAACRVQAWYQEPNYLSSFFLLGYLFFFAAGWLPGRILAGLGVVLATSRMGWIALAGVIAIEFSYLAWRITPIAPKLKLVGGALILFLTAALLLKTGVPSRIAQDQSLFERRVAAQAALLSWKAHPWIGVGPGSSGAYFAEHWEGQPLTAYLDEHLMKRDKDVYRNDPLSKDLFSEVLGEWGTLGMVFFLSGLVFWFRPVVLDRESHAERVYAALLIGWIVFCVYATSQTLPRFDLWALLTLSVGSRQTSK